MKTMLASRFRPILLTTLAVYFTFIGGTFITDLNFWPRVVHHIIVTFLIGAWILSLIRRKVGIPHTPFNIAIASFYCIAVIATVFATDVRVSAEALWQIGFHCLLFLMLVDLMRLWSPRTILNPVFLVSGVVIFVGIFEFLSWYFGIGWLPIFKVGWFSIGGFSNPIPPISYRLGFTLGVVTFLSAYLALIIPIGIAWALTEPQRDVRFGLWIWVGGAALVELLSFSRGGLLSLGISLPAFGLLIFLSQPDPVNTLQKLWSDWRVKTFAVMGVLLLVTLGIIWTRRYVEGSHAASDAVRTNLWSAAWHVGLDDPLTGAGPYGFGRAMRAYRDPTITADHLTSAHDIPLQVWAELGIPGVVVLVWLVALLFRVGYGCLNNSTGLERIRFAGTCAGLMGFGAQNLVDTTTNTPVLLLVFSLIAYLCYPQTEQPSRMTNRWGIAAPIVLLSGFVVGTIGIAISDVAQFYFARSIRLASQDNFNEAIETLAHAQTLDPGMGYYSAQAAQYEAVLASEDAAHLPQTLATIDTALSYEDTYSLMLANHAMLLSQEGDSTMALKEIDKAITNQPNDPQYWLIEGMLQEKASGDAEQVYMEALKLAPHWVGSSFWDKTELRRDVRSAFLKKYGNTEYNADQMANLPVQCWPRQPSTGKVNEPSNPFCEAVIEFRINLNRVGALMAINRAVELNTTDPNVYLERAWINVALGKLAEAENDAQIALFLGNSRAYGVLGAVLEESGELEQAIENYSAGGPVIVRLQGWDVAVYLRRGDLFLLPIFDAPGPPRYDLTAWIRLYRLYVRLGRQTDADNVRNAILRVDPYFDVSELEAQP